MVCQTNEYLINIFIFVNKVVTPLQVKQLHNEALRNELTETTKRLQKRASELICMSSTQANKHFNITYIASKALKNRYANLRRSKCHYKNIVTVILHSFKDFKLYEGCLKIA